MMTREYFLSLTGLLRVFGAGSPGLSQWAGYAGVNLGPKGCQERECRETLGPGQVILSWSHSVFTRNPRENHGLHFTGEDTESQRGRGSLHCIAGEQQNCALPTLEGNALAERVAHRD